MKVVSQSQFIGNSLNPFTTMKVECSSFFLILFTHLVSVTLLKCVLTQQTYMWHKSIKEMLILSEYIYIYINFSTPVAQQRVLQKSKHVVDFAGVTIELIVRDNPGPASGDTSPPSDQSANPNLNASTASPVHF